VFSLQFHVADLLIDLFAEAFWDNLYKEKAGEAKAALGDLESLAKERDSTVVALTLRSVDDIAADVVEIKSVMYRVEGNLSDGMRGLDQTMHQEVAGLKQLIISRTRIGAEQSEPKPRGE
jgi:hypothetical protein